MWTMPGQNLYSSTNSMCGGRIVGTTCLPSRALLHFLCSRRVASAFAHSVSGFEAVFLTSSCTFALEDGRRCVQALPDRSERRSLAYVYIVRQASTRLAR